MGPLQGWGLRLWSWECGPGCTGRRCTRLSWTSPGTDPRSRLPGWVWSSRSRRRCGRWWWPCPQRSPASSSDTTTRWTSFHSKRISHRTHFPQWRTRCRDIAAETSQVLKFEKFQKFDPTVQILRSYRFISINLRWGIRFSGWSDY